MMLLEDRAFSLFRGIGVGIGLGPWFAGAGLLTLIGAAFLIWRRLRSLGWSLILIATAVAWVGLLVVSECQTEIRLSEIITARSHRFPDVAREAAQVGVIAVPVLGALALLLQRRGVRNRRRQLLSMYVRQASKSFYEGDFDRAITEYGIAIKIDSTLTESFIKRGRAYFEKGEYDRAIADFDRALALDALCAPAYLYRGMVRAAKGDHGAAVSDLERAGELEPSNPAPSLYRGMSLAKIGETARAAEDFRRVLRLTNHSDFTEPAKFHLAMLEDRPTPPITVITLS